MQIYLLFSFPEFLLTIGILLILLISVFLKTNVFKLSIYLSNILLIFVALSVIINNQTNYLNYDSLFSNNQFIISFKLLIIFSCILCLLILENYFNDLDLKNFEIPVLMLFAVLGMLIMISANNIMSMYLGIELQSLSLYVLASIQKKSIKSSEAGLKYFILGALSSGILLYGLSLIYGFTGNTEFIKIYESLSTINELNLGIIFGLVFVIVALAFKVSAVPFHMWTPDVYEGSPTPVTAFFAMVPKIAAVGLLIRFLMGPFGEFLKEWQQMIIFISIASMLLGALAAMMQDNIKRLLAYSAIGHIGYILIGLTTGTDTGVRGIIIYLCIYIMMNAGIFAILLSLKIKGQYVESIKNLSGLSKKNPAIGVVLAILMFSMAGIPPFAGFFGKFYIFIAALEAGLIILAIIGVLASVIAAYYYIRIIKVIFFDDELNNFEIEISYKNKIVILISTVFTTFFILQPSIVVNFATKASTSIF